MLFTGNNLAPAGDMASRSLVCSLDVTRPDPENRPFAHPDPIAWTIANRSRLMSAFYTLLLWNPYLRRSMAKSIAPKTRFKTWWSSIGAPIQAVTNRIGAPVDFAALFAANEVGDHEADGVAAICEAIGKKFGGKVFTVKEFCVLLDPGPEPTGFVSPAKRADWRAANDAAIALREALQSIHDVPLPSGLLPHQRVGQIIGKATNRPVRVGERIVRLRPVHKGHAGNSYQLQVL
jgi:hypothetical protein